ncbi:MAG: AAA family ATPase, partial [Clostridia bacterium]|nr:AAA family ATPase [Clostridia bacterium]
KNQRSYTFLGIEEPEAHLHPHLQRKIFKHLFEDGHQPDRSLLLTTHSPNIASVTPLKSVVVLRTGPEGTKGYSLAHVPLSSGELEDLQRYINATRADLLFSRGVIFVEGDAEAALLPVFAASLGYDLDELGIAVCNVAGVNFTPYVKLAAALGMPHAVITDWDPLTGVKPPLGKARALALVVARRIARGKTPPPQAVL